MPDALYIGGRWEDAASGERLDVVDPATEEVFASVPAGGEHDIGRAVDAAVEAFAGRWRRSEGRDRAAHLRAMAEAIRRDRSGLAELEVRDNGKPLPEALWDIDDAAGCFDYYADLAEELDGMNGEAVALPDPRFTCTLRHEPVGVAALVIPWNYPLLMAAWKVAPALAAGATAVLKPSELTPLTALRLAGIAHEAGVPPGVLNVVTGTGPAAGAPLVSHPVVAKVAFTGSVPTGAGILAAAASDIKNVSIEAGGKSPFVVFDDADIEAAVEWVMFGIFWNQGQVCSATSRLLIQDGLAAPLLSRLVEEAGRIPIGNGLHPGTLLGPLVSAGQHAKVLRFVEDARRDGGRILCGGVRPPARESGYFLAPTIIADLPDDAAAWREEIFGPVLCVRTFSSEEEAVRLANDSTYGLAAAVMSADASRCERVAAALEAGIVWINCSQPTFAQAPWGGVKRSGIGRELGRWGLANYLEVKQVTRYVSPEPWGWYLKPPLAAQP